MSSPFFSAECINERNKALIKAGEAIIDARKVIDQLDEILRATVFGQFPDVGQVADLTAKLSDAHDRILVGLVESSVVKQKRLDDQSFIG